ncbi:Uncharacterised protein [Segatella copri]|nr:Uncharacterised protein [Segatella copri]
MVLCRELTNKLAFLLPCSQLLSYHARKQLLCLDERNLYVSVRVAVEAKLASYVSWQAPQHLQTHGSRLLQGL